MVWKVELLKRYDGRKKRVGGGIKGSPSNTNPSKWSNGSEDNGQHLEMANSQSCLQGEVE